MFDIFHYTVTKNLIFTSITNFNRKVSIGKLSSFQGLIQVFQILIFTSRPKFDYWQNCCQLFSLALQALCSLLTKFMSNTSSPVNHRLSIALFFQVKMIFHGKKQLDQLPTHTIAHMLFLGYSLYFSTPGKWFMHISHFVT